MTLFDTVTELVALGLRWHELDMQSGAIHVQLVGVSATSSSCSLGVGKVTFPTHSDPPLLTESALRRVALGRKNFLFVGNEAAGENLAGLYSLVATCEANDVNPVEYLADVLVRVNEHPNSKLDELLPHNWCGPPNSRAPSSPR